VGNGLRPEVWGPFQKRFKIPLIVEFYASTEGNAGTVNFFGKEGAVGFISPLIRRLYPIKLVKFDIEKEVPVRDANGNCIECAPDEPGELIGLIDQSDPTREFVGYTDKAATEKKILRNAFKKGDMWFRTGDLIRIDKEGFVYFVDRIGDTFRWKGENVSTSEVGEVISGVDGVVEVNVYGVHLPNKDGRAGMASIVAASNFSVDALYKHINKNLPKFAQPLFVRLQPEMLITGTFKHKKVDLVKEGFNPDDIKDPLFFRDDALQKFVPLDAALYSRIISNQAKL